jgi:hypothetical protein
MPARHLQHVFVRLSEIELEISRRKAREVGLPVAATIRRLIRESDQPAVKQMSNKFDNPTSEVDLHLLVAIEQVIALIETILPEGPGAARRALPEAVLAAQRRLELQDEDDSE